MSIASEITRLQGVKSNILQAISDKGVTVPTGSALADCPGLIADIPTGGVIYNIPDNSEGEEGDFAIVGAKVYLGDLGTIIEPQVDESNILEGPPSAWKCLDGDNATYLDLTTNGYFVYDFGLGNEKSIHSVSILPYTSSTSFFLMLVYGSNDGKIYKGLTAAIFPGYYTRFWQSCIFDNNNSYRFYKFQFCGTQTAASPPLLGSPNIYELHVNDIIPTVKTYSTTTAFKKRLGVWVPCFQPFGILSERCKGWYRLDGSSSGYVSIPSSDYCNYNGSSGRFNQENVTIDIECVIDSDLLSFTASSNYMPIVGSTNWTSPVCLGIIKRTVDGIDYIDVRVMYTAGEYNSYIRVTYEKFSQSKKMNVKVQKATYTLWLDDELIGSTTNSSYNSTATVSLSSIYILGTTQASANYSPQIGVKSLKITDDSTGNPIIDLESVKDYLGAGAYIDHRLERIYYVSNATIMP